MTAPLALPSAPLAPSKPVTKGGAVLGSQRDRRFTDTFWDTFKHPSRFPNGRPFTGEREFTSGTQTESITAGFITSDLQCGAFFCESPEMGQTPAERMETLASCWSAPWLPIAKYFRFNYRHKRVTFALDKMISDENDGLRKYWEAAAKIAGENDIIDPERPLAVPFRIRTLLGTPAMYTDKIKLARAMQSGDPWLLGHVDEPNEGLAKVLGFKINYIGGRAGDSEHTLVKLPTDPKPVVTPEQVLAVGPSDLAKMIADAVEASLAARDAEKKAKDQAKMSKVRAKKGAAS